MYIYMDIYTQFPQGTEAVITSLVYKQSTMTEKEVLLNKSESRFVPGNMRVH